MLQRKSEMLVYCRLKLGRNNSEKSLKTYFQHRDCVLVKTIERRVIIQCHCFLKGRLAAVEFFPFFLKH